MAGGTLARGKQQARKCPVHRPRPDRRSGDAAACGGECGWSERPPAGAAICETSTAPAPSGNRWLATGVGDVCLAMVSDWRLRRDDWRAAGARRGAMIGVPRFGVCSAREQQQQSRPRPCSGTSHLPLLLLFYRLRRRRSFSCVTFVELGIRKRRFYVSSTRTRDLAAEPLIVADGHQQL
jgi:hypothetical protein